MTSDDTQTHPQHGRTISKKKFFRNFFDHMSSYLFTRCHNLLFPSLLWVPFLPFCGCPFLCPPCLCFSKTFFFGLQASRRGLFFCQNSILKKLNKFLFFFYIVFACFSKTFDGVPPSI